jgi:putative ABC transport system permease protein
VAIIAVLLAGALSVPLTGTLMNPVFSMTGISQVDYTYNILNITAVFPGIIIAMTVISVFITSLYTNKIKSSDMANLE